MDADGLALERVLDRRVVQQDDAERAVRDRLQPVVDKAGGTISSDLAPGIIGARYALLARLPLKANLIATRIRQLGIARVLYGSDGAGGGNLVPRATTRRAISCLPPLDETSFRPFSAPCRDLR